MRVHYGEVVRGHNPGAVVPGGAEGELAEGDAVIDAYHMIVVDLGGLVHGHRVQVVVVEQERFHGHHLQAVPLGPRQFLLFYDLGRDPLDVLVLDLARLGIGGPEHGRHKEQERQYDCCLLHHLSSSATFTDWVSSELAINSM